MSLFDRLDFTRSNRQKLKSNSASKVPIWERIDLTRPSKLKCHTCRHSVNFNWQLCPYCGQTLSNKQSPTKPYCIWVRVGDLDIYSDRQKLWSEILADALTKVFSALRSVNVFLTTTTPDSQEYGNDFTQVLILSGEIKQTVDYLGVASFSLGKVTNMAIVRIDKICHASYIANLSLNQLSNLIANTIAHEIGHTLGLEHSALDTDVMHDGLDYRIHSLMPPSFYAEQINLMNHAIKKHKLS